MRSETPSPMPAIRGPFPTLTTEADPAGKIGMDLRMARLERVLQQWLAYMGKVPNALNSQEGTVLGEIFARLSKLEKAKEKEDEQKEEVQERRAPYVRAWWIVLAAFLGGVTMLILGAV